eukprot:gb/GECG01010502.1/.p1 GENE.gb/GECG01010502.1/~~gb/GECG01010502.1/.p1  ORF type:complete len:158 (+),score=26.55 gb/GECG01010502.1/:1-474(+)
MSAAAASSSHRTGRKLRILALHGFLQNATMFRQKTAALRKHLKSVAEFDYIDGPIRLNNTSWQDLVAEGGGTLEGNGELSETAKSLIYRSSTETSANEGNGDEQVDSEQDVPLYSWFHFKDRAAPAIGFQETTEKYLDEYIRKNGWFAALHCVRVYI